MSAGWYPDPSNPNEWLRWWDGQQWTGHVHPLRQPDAPTAQPAHAPQPAQAPAQHKRRIRLWAIIAPIAIVALVLVIAVPMVVSRMLGGGSELSAIDELPVAYTDESLGLDFTEPVLDIEDRNASVKMTFHGDVRQGDESPEGSLTAHKWAVRLFSDPSLKSEITTSVTQSGDDVSITTYEEETATWFSAQPDAEDAELVMKSETSAWGLHEDYYLVRYVDADGYEFERPVVTRFSFTPRLDAPKVTAGTDPERPGDLALNWTPVEGPDRYAVVYGRSPAADDTGDFEDTGYSLGLYYVYMGETTETQWTVSESFTERARADDGTTVRNGALQPAMIDEELVRESSEGDEFVPTDLSGDEIGVIAIAADGTTSPLGTTNARSAISNLPSNLARATFELAVDDAERTAPAGTIAAPFYVPYIDFTGRIQYSPAQLTDVSVSGGTLNAVLVSENGYRLPFQTDAPNVADTAALQAQVRAFNAAAIDAAGNPGVLQALSDSAVEAGTAQSEHEDTGLPTPTAPSHPMVTYLAGHMLAGTSIIDVSEWVDEPGAPSALEAASEAREQTPLAFVAGVHLESPRTAVRVSYDYPAEERTQKQEEIHQLATAAVDGMGLDGKSDAEKITAFNDYLTATVEYDHEAYETVGDKSDYKYAYNVYGALTSGDAVCAGYAETMNLFAQLEGIPSMYVVGKVTQGGRHAWNKFLVDDIWQNVDTTWNDGEVPHHDYLLISDADFTGSAERTEDPDGWVIGAYAHLYAAP